MSNVPSSNGRLSTGAVVVVTCRPAFAARFRARRSIPSIPSVSVRSVDAAGVVREVEAGAGADLEDAALGGGEQLPPRLADHRLLLHRPADQVVAAHGAIRSRRAMRGVSHHRIAAVIVEQRDYHVYTGKLNELVGLYETEGIELQQRYLGGFIGAFTTDVGALSTYTQPLGLRRLRRARAPPRASSRPTRRGRPSSRRSSR